MADQPQPTTPAPASNSNRITAMLQDLATQRAAGAVPARPTPQPTRPAPMAPSGAPPPNLPTTPAPRPATPPPTPVAPMPSAPRPIAVAPIPQPSTPPPAPKEAPVAPMPSIPRPPSVPTPITPPAPPAMPQKPIVSAPVAPPTTPQDGYSSELRTMSADIGNIKVGQAPAGIIKAAPAAGPITPPAAPIVPPISAPKAPSIVIPDSGSSSGSSKRFVYGIIAAITLIAITYALVTMIGGGSTTETTPTPSPSSSTTPAPTLGGKNLRSYFGNPGSSINLQSVTTGKADFLNGLVSVQTTSKQAVSLAIQHQGTGATMSTFFDDTVGSLPSGLSGSLGTDWVLLAFGQSEAFDSTGTQTTVSGTELRLILIAEVTDVAKANRALIDWETTGLASVSAQLMALNTTNRIVSAFSSGTYRETQVRYWNFPYADHSVDYAIVSASNNRKYLVLAASREAAFFAIDQLQQ